METDGRHCLYGDVGGGAPPEAGCFSRIVDDLCIDRVVATCFNPFIVRREVARETVTIGDLARNPERVTSCGHYCVDE